MQGAQEKRTGQKQIWGNKPERRTEGRDHNWTKGRKATVFTRGCNGLQTNTHLIHSKELDNPVLGACLNKVNGLDTGCDTSVFILSISLITAVQCYLEAYAVHY